MASTDLELDAIGFEALAELVGAMPFHRWLGVSLTALDADGVTFAVPWRDEFISHPARRYAHGGILATLVDIGAHFAVAARLGRNLPTIDLRTDFHRSVTGGTMSVRGRVLRIGPVVASSEAEVRDQAGSLIASGRGSFMSLPRRGG